MLYVALPMDPSKGSTNGLIGKMRDKVYYDLRGSPLSIPEGGKAVLNQLLLRFAGLSRSKQLLRQFP